MKQFASKRVMFLPNGNELRVYCISKEEYVAYEQGEKAENFTNIHPTIALAVVEFLKQ